MDFNELQRLLAIIMRFVLIPVLYYMFNFFRKGYKKSKESGFDNKFFVGFMFMFLTLFLFSVIAALYDILQILIPDLPGFFELKFPGSDEPGVEERMWILFNLVRTQSYVLGIAVTVLVFAAQIYPLEQIIGWKRTPLTKIMIILSPMLLLIFIPALTWTYYSPIIMALCILSLLIALFLNIGVNFKLALSTTGAVKQRSIKIILAFFLFYLGFVMSLEVDWMGAIWSGFSLKMDIVVGNIVMICGAFLYRSGFKLDEIKESR